MITVVSVFILSWLYIGMPVSFETMFGQIRPLQKSAELPTWKSVKENMPSVEGSERNAKWTEIHRQLIVDFENLKQDPCNKDLIRVYGKIVSEYFLFAKEHESDSGFYPLDEELADRAESALGDSIYYKYIVRQDMSNSALRVFSLDNTQRLACKG